MALTLENLDLRATAVERAQSETTETLRWVVTKLARVQAVQDEHTLRLERVEARLERVEERLGTLEAKIDALPRAMAELIEASENRVLAAIAEQ
jgi:septal ring factor EnvC (AmiA/AmiB activator)